MNRTTKFIFATHNEHKVSEVRRVLPVGLELVSLKDLKYDQEIPETGQTLEENAELKARTIYNHFFLPVIAEDTGLEVDILGGAPGVLSARYAGPHASGQENMQKLLIALTPFPEKRAAKFRTVFVCIIDGHSYRFDGEINGKIAMEPGGIGGFGYDPIFIPQGYDLTFAELGNDIKIKISHRTKAWQKLVEFFQTR